MTTYYVRSTDGNNADDGSTWTLAKADLQTPTWAAGDVIYVSDAHAQTTAAVITIDSNGTITSPTRILGVDDAAEPPTTMTTTAVVETTGNSTIAITDSCYIYGIRFKVGTGNFGPVLLLNNTGVASHQVLEACAIEQPCSGGSANGYVGMGGSGTGTGLAWDFVNCTFKFAATTQRWLVGGRGGIVNVRGGSMESGTTTPSYLLLPASGAGLTGIFNIAGFDFSNLATTFNFIGEANTTAGLVTLRDCKLPTNWAGSLISAQMDTPGFRAEMHNCDSGDTNYQLWVEDYAGSIKSETTIVRSDGASDGTTSLSWKMASSTYAEYPHQPLVSPEIVVWNDTTGSSKTVTVEIVHDSQGAGSGNDFQDDEIWLEVMYLGTSGAPLGTFTNNAKANVLATAADHANSSVTWTTTGLSTPVKQALAVSFTPQEKGYIHVTVKLAKASKTVYVDPKLTIS